MILRMVGEFELLSSKVHHIAALRRIVGELLPR